MRDQLSRHYMIIIAILLSGGIATVPRMVGEGSEARKVEPVQNQCTSQHLPVAQQQLEAGEPVILLVRLPQAVAEHYKLLKVELDGRTVGQLHDGVRLQDAGPLLRAPR